MIPDTIPRFRHSPFLTPIPTPAAQESASVDFVNTGSTNLTAHAEFLTPRVVDPLSPTVADSKMINLYRPNSFWCRFH